MTTGQQRAIARRMAEEQHRRTMYAHTPNLFLPPRQIGSKYRPDHKPKPTRSEVLEAIRSDRRPHPKPRHPHRKEGAPSIYSPYRISARQRRVES